MVHGFQAAFLLPLLLLPFAWSRGLYEEGVRYTKGSFATLISELQAPYRDDHSSTFWWQFS
jgi:hypothetical protein